MRGRGNSAYVRSPFIIRPFNPVKKRDFVGLIDTRRSFILDCYTAVAFVTAVTTASSSFIAAGLVNTTFSTFAIANNSCFAIDYSLSTIHFVLARRKAETAVASAVE